MNRRNALITLAAGTATMIITGCTGQQSSTSSTSASASASASSSSSSKGATPPEPVRHEKKVGPGWTLIVPSQWEERVSEGSKLTIKPLVWVMPGTFGSERMVFASIVIDDERKNDAEGQSTFMEKTATATGKLDFKREHVEIDGAKDAWLVQWDEEISDKSKSHVIQVMAQRSDGLIVNALGRAPADQVKTLDIEGIVRSLKLT